MTLVSGSDVVRLIDALEAAGALIVGFEGFRLDGPAIMPVEIADFSDVTDPAESTAAARRGIEEIGRLELYYEFVIADRT
jgi:hypothetical protein